MSENSIIRFPEYLKETNIEWSTKKKFKKYRLEQCTKDSDFICKTKYKLEHSAFVVVFLFKNVFFIFF